MNNNRVSFFMSEDDKRALDSKGLSVGLSGNLYAKRLVMADLTGQPADMIKELPGKSLANDIEARARDVLWDMSPDFQKEEAIAVVMEEVKREKEQNI